MQYLKQSTAVTVMIGPLVDGTDGFTPETAITLAAGEADLYKTDSATRLDISGATWAHVAKGVYSLALTAAHTDTAGGLLVIISDAAARPFRFDATVLPAAVYDSLIGGTDKLPVDVLEFNGNAAAAFLTGTTMLKADVSQLGGNAVASFLSGTNAVNANLVAVSGTAAAADNLEASALAIVTGAVQTGSTTTTVVTDLTETTNDHFNGRTVIFTSGVMEGQAASISDYAGATKTLTVPQLTEAPAAGVTFVIV